mmetsp:Transcript_91205/g.294819  ORF Transcript_91205/g.294819 Transcript_91205/m.294819 type:complete len:1673 (+) Transcript_91205:55-5073(+)
MSSAELRERQPLRMEDDVLAIPGGDSFDDICDQIRMLRASVVPGTFGRSAADFLISTSPLGHLRPQPWPRPPSEARGQRVRPPPTAGSAVSPARRSQLTLGGSPGGDAAGGGIVARPGIGGGGPASPPVLPSWVGNSPASFGSSKQPVHGIWDGGQPSEPLVARSPPQRGMLDGGQPSEPLMARSPPQRGTAPSTFGGSSGRFAPSPPQQYGSSTLSAHFAPPSEPVARSLPQSVHQPGMWDEHVRFVDNSGREPSHQGVGLSPYGGSSSSTFGGTSFSPPIRKQMRLTLWQERQLAMCFRAWAEDCAPREAHSMYILGSPRSSISSPGRGGPLQLSRVGGGIRLQADELSRSVKLLDVQVRSELKRGLSHWHALARVRALQRAKLRAGDCIRSLKWWHGLAVSNGQRRSTTDQACALLRMSQIKDTLKWWASVGPHRCQAVLEDSAKEQVRQKNAKCMALKRWLEFLQGPVRCRRIVAERQKAEEVNLRASVFRKMAQQVELSRQDAQDETECRQHMQDYRKSTALRSWFSWSHRRLQRAALLHGHQHTLVKPRMQRDAFQCWAANVRCEQRHHTALQRASIIMALSTKSRTFHGWRGAARSLACGVSKLSGLRVRLCAELLIICCDFWHAWAARQRRNRQVLASRDVDGDNWLLSCFFTALFRYVEYRRAKHKRMEIALVFADRRLYARQLLCWRLAASAERRERSSHLIASQHCDRRSVHRMFCLWMAGVVDSKLERRHEGFASQHRLHTLKGFAFRFWLRLHFSERRERQHEVLARGRRPQVLGRAALDCWLRYRVGRRQKRFSQARERCTGAIKERRRRHIVRAWVTAKTGLHGALGADKRLMRKATLAFASWRHASQRRRAQAESVKVALHSKRQALVLGSWHGLWAASRSYSSSGHQALLRRVFAVWVGYLFNLNDQREVRLQEGWALQDQRLVSLGLSLWWQAILSIRNLRECFDALAVSLKPVLREVKRDAFKTGLDSWWDWLELTREQDDLELRAECFAAWLHCCREALHRRSLIILCDRYRISRSLRRAFASWQAGCVRNLSLEDAVLLWVASRATRRATFLFRAWAARLAKRRRARAAAEAVRQLRRSNVLMSMRRALLLHLVSGGVVRTMQLRRQLSWLQAWRSWCTLHVARKARDEVRSSAVKNSRQLRCFDRWRDAGRINRLTNVASAWDSRNNSRELVRTAMFAWSASMALYVRAERVAARIGGMRARSVLRGWATLQTALEVRPRKAASQVLRAWHRAKLHNDDCSKRIERLTIRRTVPAFQALTAHREQGTKKNRAAQDLCARFLQRDVGAAFRWWCHCSAEGSREKRLVAQYAALIRERDDRRDSEIRSLLPHMFERWREHLLSQKVRIFRDEHPRLANDAAGVPALGQAFQALAHFTQHRRHLQACAEKVRALNSARVQPLVFNEWVQVYEHVASAHYAVQILDRWRASRILEGWCRIAGFRRRLVSHVMDVQHIKDMRHIGVLFKNWWRQARALFLAQGLWMQSQNALVGAALVVWVAWHRERRTLRQGFRDLRAGSKSFKGRRRAEVVRLSGMLSLAQKTFVAFSEAVRRAQVLRARCASLTESVREDRLRRRVVLWAVRGREEQRVMDVRVEALQAWRGAVPPRAAPQFREAGLRQTPSFFEEQHDTSALMYDQRMFGRPSPAPCFCFG